MSADSQAVTFDSGAKCWVDIGLVQESKDDDLVGSITAYKGEPLPGFYDDWGLLKSERLRRDFDRKIQQLLEQLLEDDTIRFLPVHDDCQFRMDILAGSADAGFGQIYHQAQD